MKGHDGHQMSPSDLTAQAKPIMTQIDKFTTMMGFKNKLQNHNDIIALTVLPIIWTTTDCGPTAEL